MHTNYEAPHYAIFFNWKLRNAYKILDGYPEGRPLGRPSIDGRIISKWILWNSVCVWEGAD
jgi:hypothetical protein